MMSINFKKYSIVCVLFCVLFLLAGCDDEEKKSETEQTPPQPPKQEQQIQVKIYFPTRDGMELGVLEKEVSNKNRYKETVELLIAGTTEKNLCGIFPKNVVVRHINVNPETGECLVDFSKELTKNFVGGSTGEEMLLSSLVNTLTEFPEIKSVRIHVEGKPVDTIAGHIDTSVPLLREEKKS